MAGPKPLLTEIGSHKYESWELFFTCRQVECVEQSVWCGCVPGQVVDHVPPEGEASALLDQQQLDLTAAPAAGCP